MLQVIPIPAFEDNYIWLLTLEGYSGAVVVDPGDEEPVLERLAGLGLSLEAVLVTHHHGDHTGGIEALQAKYPALRVYGPRDPRIPALSHPLADGDAIRLLGGALALRVLAVPGHTTSHIAYLGAGCLFPGDTLFSAGCGRVLGGTFTDLAASLRRLGTLPGDTWVYCAHEYTLANLGFARWVEPDNPALAHRLESVRTLRAAGQPTVPTPLSLELATNPFLRTGVPAVIAAAERRAGQSLADPTAVFTTLRRWKDQDYD